jgi:lysophosphatidate acyltransferase
VFYLRFLLGLLAFVAASAYGISIALFRRDKSRVASDYAHLLGRLQRPALGIRVRAVGVERLQAHRPCIIISNHQSMLDVPILAEVFGPGQVVIAKRELRSIPFFGWLYTVTGNIFLDRGHHERAMKSLREAEEEIRRRKVAVWIFPEGTRGREPGKLLPFKKGAFHLAVRTGAPLIPVVVSPLRPSLDLEGGRLQPGTVEVRVLDPVPTGGLTERDIPRLMDEARHRMGAALMEMAASRGLPAPAQ